MNDHEQSDLGDGASSAFVEHRAAPSGLLRWSERTVKMIDALNGATGALASWLALGMVLVGAFNAVARYVGRAAGVSLSSNALIEVQWYMFGAMFLLAGAYTFREERHVRVDVFYGRVGEKTRAWINLLGILFFLWPFCVAALLFSWSSVFESWRILEGSPDPGGLPRYPLKSLLLIAFGLLFLQGVSNGIKAVQVLRGASRHRAEPRA